MDVMIVDDEPLARRALRELCAATADLRVVGEFADGQLALEAIRRQRPDLLFLDIQMDRLDGMTLARSLDADAPPAIVFVTAYDRFAVEAFEVSALDYLLKPFDEQRFARTLVRVRERLGTGEAAAPRLGAVLERLEKLALAAEGERPRLLAERSGSLHVLDVQQVELLEADRNYVRVTVGRDVFHLRSTLHQAEQLLLSQPMLRISRSCLLNMNHLREVSRTPRGDFILVLGGGVTVTSSEGYRDKVRNHLERLKPGGT